MEKLGGSKISAPQENLGGNNADIRRKYLVAMAVAIGVVPSKAELRAKRLLKDFNDPAKIKDFVVGARSVGEYLLAGSEQRKQLGFAIGSRALSFERGS